jgi:hypothetical protein
MAAAGLGQLVDHDDVVPCAQGALTNAPHGHTSTVHPGPPSMLRVLTPSDPSAHSTVPQMQRRLGFLPGWLPAERRACVRAWCRYATPPADAAAATRAAQNRTRTGASLLLKYQQWVPAATSHVRTQRAGGTQYPATRRGRLVAVPREHLAAHADTQSTLVNAQEQLALTANQGVSTAAHHAQYRTRTGSSAASTRSARVASAAAAAAAALSPASVACCTCATPPPPLLRSKSRES